MTDPRPTIPPPVPVKGLRYRRVLLKLSGEALCNPEGHTEAFGIQPHTLSIRHVIAARYLPRAGEAGS